MDQGSTSVTVLTSTGYSLPVPWNGNFNSIYNGQIYFTNAAPCRW